MGSLVGGKLRKTGPQKIVELVSWWCDQWNGLKDSPLALVLHGNITEMDAALIQNEATRHLQLAVQHETTDALTCVRK